MHRPVLGGNHLDIGGAVVWTDCTDTVREDHGLCRKGVIKALEREPEGRWLAVASDIVEIYTAARAVKVHVLLQLL